MTYCYLTPLDSDGPPCRQRTMIEVYGWNPWLPRAHWRLRPVEVLWHHTRADRVRWQAAV